MEKPYQDGEPRRGTWAWKNWRIAQLEADNRRLCAINEEISGELKAALKANTNLFHMASDADSRTWRVAGWGGSIIVGILFWWAIVSLVPHAGGAK